jgi:hypothetical protein
MVSFGPAIRTRTVKAPAWRLAFSAQYPLFIGYRTDTTIPHRFQPKRHLPYLMLTSMSWVSYSCPIRVVAVRGIWRKGSATYMPLHLSLSFCIRLNLVGYS